MTPNHVIIDLEAIRHNFREIQRTIGPDKGVIAVIKSDAYGHGMVPVAQALAPDGPAGFAVFELEEALALNRAGCGVPILILMGIAEAEAPAAVEYGLAVSLFDLAVAEALSREALKQKKTAAVQIKVDTGMARLGVPWTDVPAFLERIAPLRGLRLEGMFTHLAVADEPDNPFTDEQIRRFREVVGQARRQGISVPAAHLANSAAVLRGLGLDLPLVRPGIILYGSSPAASLAGPLRFRPAMTFQSRVVRVEQFPAGTPVSYGCTYRMERPSTIATVPAGYDDGFNRLLSNRAEVLIRGRRVPVVGRVCMNLTMVDVSAVSGVSVGDEVVLLGSQGKETISAEEWAAKIGTISYEVYCTLGKSNRCTYLNRLSEG